MKNKLLIASFALSGLVSAQCNYKCGYNQDENGNTVHLEQCNEYESGQNNCPNIQDVSWVLGDENQKYVVSLLDSEIYSDKLDTSVERDTFIVSSNYPIYHLIDETEWEENCQNCDEID